MISPEAVGNMSVGSQGTPRMGRPLTHDDIPAITSAVFDAFADMLIAAEKHLYFYTNDDGSTPDADTVNTVFRAIKDSVEWRRRELNPEPPQPAKSLRSMLAHEIYLSTYMSTHYPMGPTEKQLPRP